MDGVSLRVSAPLLGLVLLIAATVPAVAQDEPDASGSRYPLFLVITSKIDRTMVNEYSAAMAQVVAAHKDHEKGNSWAAFTHVTGGPDPMFHYFLPIQSMGDIDDWVPNQQVIMEAHGAEAGGRVIQTLSECATSSRQVLGHNSALSNPSAERTQSPPAFIYFVHSKVEPSRINDYLPLMQKVKSAHQEHESGVSWLAYNNMIGGEGAQFFYFAGMETLGDLDGWVTTRQALIDAYGAKEAAAIQKRLSQVSESETSILSLVPSLSHAKDSAGGGD